jgi:hypothetical protein
VSENKRLKRDLQKMSLENKMLKETYSINGTHSLGHDGPPVITWPPQQNHGIRRDPRVRV